MEKVSDDILNEMTRRLVAEFDPEQVFLFGSRAWGKPNEDSDVDFLVIVSQSNLRPVERAVLAHQCLRDICIPVDILVKTRAEFDFYRDVRASLECAVLERGRMLYDRSQASAGKKLAIESAA